MFSVEIFLSLELHGQSKQRNKNEKCNNIICYATLFFYNIKMFDDKND